MKSKWAFSEFQHHSHVYTPDVQNAHLINIHYEYILVTDCYYSRWIRLCTYMINKQQIVPSFYLNFAFYIFFFYSFCVFGSIQFYFCAGRLFVLCILLLSTVCRISLQSLSTKFPVQHCIQFDFSISSILLHHFNTIITL